MFEAYRQVLSESGSREVSHISPLQYTRATEGRGRVDVQGGQNGGQIGLCKRAIIYRS